MDEASDQPTAAVAVERPGWRTAVGGALRTRRLLIALEVLFIGFAFILRGLGVIRNASLLLFLMGWFSLWLRSVGWRGVGLRRPTNWWQTVLLGIAIGIAYDAADIFAVLPAIRRLTGQAVQLEQFGALRGKFGTLLLLLLLTWVFGAFVEEMAYRGYALNRIADLFGRSRVAFALSTIAVSSLFGFAHMKQGISGVLDNIAAGLVFTVLYFVSGRNLWLPVIVHGVVDTTSLVLLYFGLAPNGY